MTLAEAAAQADALAQAGDERALATLRAEWDDEIEAAARNPDYRVRAQAYRAIAQFRFRKKLELAARDPNVAVRRLAVICLKNGTPQRDTLQLLEGIAESEDVDADLRKTARVVHTALKKKAVAR